MGGRGGSGGSTSNWMKAAAGWNEWAKWRYKNPMSYAPDRIEKLAKDFETTNANYMKRAVAKSKYLTVNPYTHVAHYENAGFSVSIHGAGGGGGGIKIGVVYVDVKKPGEKAKRSFFQTHKQAVAFAEKEIKRRNNKK